MVMPPSADMLPDCWQMRLPGWHASGEAQSVSLLHNWANA
jgi:hypothetical protein